MKAVDMARSLRAEGIKWEPSFPRSWRWYGVIIGGNSREAYRMIKLVRNGGTSLVVEHLRTRLTNREEILRSNNVVFRSLL